MLHVKWSQLLAGLFAVVVAVAGGTFAIVSYAKEAEVNGYKLEQESAKNRVGELAKRLELCAHASKSAGSFGPTEQTAEPGAAVSATILQPNWGAVVGPYTEVQFATTGDFADGYKATLFVRDPLGQWWSWGSSTTGSFQGVQVGQSKDSDERFELRLLVTNKEADKNVPYLDLPPAIVSDSVIVIRR